MVRTIVERLDGFDSINVNDEIGLQPMDSYTVVEHLEDLASDGKWTIASHADLYVFSDGTFQILKQRSVEVCEELLTAEELAMLYAASFLTCLPELRPARPALVC